ARAALAAAGKASQHRAIPEPDRPFPEQPLTLHLHQPVIVVPRKTQRVRRFAATLGHEGERLHAAALTVPCHERLADMVLPARKSGRILVMLAQLAHPLPAFPPVRVL